LIIKGVVIRLADKNGIVNIRQLEDEFCTSYYLGLRNAISKSLTEAMGDDHMFLGDEEGYRFFAGMGTKVRHIVSTF